MKLKKLYINDNDNDYRKAIICFLIIIFISILISNSYFIAKYKSRINGSSGIGIAKWNVNSTIENNTNNNLNIISQNNTPYYEFNVESLSDVSTSYSIILSNVPKNLEVKLDNGTYRTSINGIITFNNAGIFLLNDVKVHNHKLTFNDLLNSNNNGSTKINIDVIFEQID